MPFSQRSSVETGCFRGRACRRSLHPEKSLANRILFVVGASGCGKTAAVNYLGTLRDFNGVCYFFDDIGVPSPEEMRALDERGVSWQREATHAWIEKLAASAERFAILEGQTTPACIAAEARRIGLARWTTILLDCDTEIRRARLALRGQPELATHQMNTWAAYLRGQADALGLAVIDTSDLTVAAVAGQIRLHADRLIESNESDT